MTRVAAMIAATMLGFAVMPANAAETCDQNQLSAAIDGAGEKLRELTVATQPVLQAKLQRLREVKGWSNQEYEEKGYASLEDERTAKLDASANDLLARLDRLSGEGGGAAPDCSRIGEIDAVSLELQATIRAKGKYVLSRLDAMIGDAAPNNPTPAAPPAPKSPSDTQPTITATAPPSNATPPQKVSPPKTADSRWATQTKSTPIPQQVPPAAATAPPAAEPAPSQPPPKITDTEGYTIDEIVNASSGLFGKVSANLARVLEHAFSKSGRPSGYILGQETGGAFIVGLRYGSGRLYLRSGGTIPIYWHGPSLGADVGAQGAQVLFLIYKVRQTEDVFSNFSGIEGSAFVVGGLGITYMSNGQIDMAPIRSGIGLRLGANLGYVRFTSKPTWNPF